MTVRENLSAANVRRYWRGMKLRHGGERKDAEALIEEYNVRTSGDTQVFSTLSGGNQQKVIIARWLRDKPRILLLDEPTHGVDVGARTQIYRLISRPPRGEPRSSSSAPTTRSWRCSVTVCLSCQGSNHPRAPGAGIDPDPSASSRCAPSKTPSRRMPRRVRSSDDDRGDQGRRRAAAGSPLGEWPADTAAPAPAPPGEPAAPGHEPPDRSGGGGVAYFIERFALLILFIVVLIFFSVWSKTAGAFGSTAKFQNLASQHQAFIVVLSMALLIPLLCGEFDLSVGAIAGFSQMAAAVAMSKHGATFGEAIVVAVLFGAIIGFANGNTVARVGVNSLIVTLGTSGILGGVVNWYAQGQAIVTGIPQSVINFGALNSVFGIPRVVFLAAGVVILVWYMVNQTPYGRYLISIGSNPRAAQLVGLPVPWIKLSAFVMSGALAGLAGILLLANSGTGSPGAGTISDTLQALAAVFLGATAIRPGQFNVEGTVIAIYFLASTVSGPRARRPAVLRQRRVQRRRAVRRGDRLHRAAQPPHRRHSHLNTGGALRGRRRLLTVAAVHARVAIACAVRWARAITVTIGLTPEVVGNALASPIHTPGVSCSSPHGLATLVAGSAPIRHEPIWWAANSRQPPAAAGSPGASRCRHRGRRRAATARRRGRSRRSRSRRRPRGCASARRSRGAGSRGRPGRRPDRRRPTRRPRRS